MQLAFWIAAFLLFYTYIGYGLLLILWNIIFKPKHKPAPGVLPDLTFIVPAYNEAGFIEKKIANCLQLDYPAGKISFLFVTDGSTDGTVAAVKLYPQIKLLHQPQRAGKSAAINRAMQSVSSPVVVLSDANTLLHPQSLLQLVSLYTDETVGGVSGEKRVVNDGHSTVGFGEKLYWQYESLLKKANAGFYTIVGAAGELFSLRTKLFQPLKEDIILDDFVISAQVCRQGFRFLYAQKAYGVEASSASIQEERKRKVRISAGCFQVLFSFPGLLNPFQNYRLAFQYLSHRVLRWVVCPLLLPAVFISNTWLFFQSSLWLYHALFWGQAAFYFLAAAGWAFARNKTTGLWLIPYYFVFMVVAQYAGFYRFITNKQTVLWDKAERAYLQAL